MLAEKSCHHPPIPGSCTESSSVGAARCCPPEETI
ncbi:hypothetical protein JOE65_001351 [Arthrobacter roseus]|nr:hypothetical protein [Arthrobacter roseus]